jgi:hypothetical protein
MDTAISSSGKKESGSTPIREKIEPQAGCNKFPLNSAMCFLHL